MWSLIHNLMQNSLRYTDAPGVVRVSLSQKQNYAQLVWEDSAPGVPDSSLPLLTERLYRVEQSRNQFSGDSGLGLAIASAIAEAHNGELTANHSALGGLAWTLMLPYVALTTPE